MVRSWGWGRGDLVLTKVVVLMAAMVVPSWWLVRGLVVWSVGRLAGGCCGGWCVLSWSVICVFSWSVSWSWLCLVWCLLVGVVYRFCVWSLCLEFVCSVRSLSVCRVFCTEIVRRPWIQFV